MSRERQDQIIEGLIIRSPVKMYVNEVLEVTTEI